MAICDHREMNNCGMNMFTCFHILILKYKIFFKKRKRFITWRKKLGAHLERKWRECRIPMSELYK